MLENVFVECSSGIQDLCPEYVREAKCCCACQHNTSVRHMMHD